VGQQSPIDFPVDSELTKEKHMEWAALIYGDEKMTMAWNEHAVRSEYTPEDGGDFALNAEIGYEYFRITSFNIRTPSEHVFQGKRRDLELQIEMIDPDTSKRLVLALTWDAVDQLPRPIFDPKEKIMDDEKWTLIGQDMLERFLSADGKSIGEVRKNGDLGMLYRNLEALPFYLYKGTLTHPDCQESRWIVVKEPLKAKRETIEVFRSIVSSSDFALGNTREVQHLLDAKQVKINPKSAPKNDPIYKKRDWEKFAQMQEEVMKKEEEQNNSKTKALPSKSFKEE
jgi:carbonic anhydrase